MIAILASGLFARSRLTTKTGGVEVKDQIVLSIPATPAAFFSRAKNTEQLNADVGLGRVERLPADETSNERVAVRLRPYVLARLLGVEPLLMLKTCLLARKVGLLLF